MLWLFVERITLHSWWNPYYTFSQCNQTIHISPLLWDFCSFSVTLECDSASKSSMSVSSSDMVCWGTVLDVEPMRRERQTFEKCILYNTGMKNIFLKFTRNSSSWIRIKRTKESTKRYESAMFTSKKHYQLLNTRLLLSLLHDGFDP